MEQRKNLNQVKAIVMAADNHFLNQLTTTIKSVCSHNKRVKFYILNDDLPQEWFRILNKYLKHIHSEVVNVRISQHSLDQFHLPNHYLSYAAYFRYFIAEYVQEDRALYLDSDIIVQDSLDFLFAIDFEGNYLAAVQDYFLGWLDNFNSGVMLVDVARWREEKIAQQLLDLTALHHEEVYGDQGVLNILFRDKWKKLDKKFNFMVGPDTFSHTYGHEVWYQEYSNPTIVHYTTDKKPWLSLSTTRFRQAWWFYYGLSWEEIVMESYSLTGDYASRVDGMDFHTAIFTNTADMLHLESLIRSLPNVQFHILAYTVFAPSVMDLQAYENVSLYPGFNPYNAQSVLEQIDFYLDINHGEEIENIIQKVKELEKPIFSFSEVCHQKGERIQIFEINELDRMVEAIRNFLTIK